MAEYINREALIAKLKQMKLGEHGLAERLFADGVYAVIAAFPSADVATVVHGWWNADETCSVCGEKSTEGLDAVKWDYWLPDYCPHCGAIMDGGADNDTN